MTKTARFSTKVARLPMGKTISLRAVFWILGLSLGLLQAWAYRFTLTSEDAIPYLDIGDAYIKRDWHTAINAYWSPLYSWFLGITLFVLRPSPEWEFFVVKLVNFALFIVAFLSFEFFLKQLIEWQRIRQQHIGRSTQIPEWLWLVVGYSLFLWTSLALTGVHLDTPDRVTAACVYVASGLILKIQSRTANWGTYLLFGAVLGLGYLSKTVMFPMAFVFFFVVIIASVVEENNAATQGLRSWSKQLKARRSLILKLVAAMLVLMLIVAPFVTVLSLSKGRFTFGDAGRLNYIWYFNTPIESYKFWQGKEPDSGTPKHAARQIVDSPPTYEFANTVGGSAPLWHDPTYWNEGLKVRFNLKRQLKVFSLNLKYYSDLFAGYLILSYCLLVYVGGYVRSSLQQLAACWYIWLPGMAGLTVYFFAVSLAESGSAQYRLVAPFVLLVCMGAFSGLCLRTSSTSRRLMLGLILAAIIAMGGQLLVQTSYTVARMVVGYQQTPVFAQAVEDLKLLGVKSGDSIAVIGENVSTSIIARLARIQIIAQVPSVKDFWQSDAVSQTQVLQAIKKTGAKLVVQQMDTPIPSRAAGWQKLKNSSCYVYLFNKM